MIGAVKDVDIGVPGGGLGKFIRVWETRAAEGETFMKEINGCDGEDGYEHHNKGRVMEQNNIFKGVGVNSKESLAVGVTDVFVFKIVSDCKERPDEEHHGLSDEGLYATQLGIIAKGKAKVQLDTWIAPKLFEDTIGRNREGCEDCRRLVERSWDYSDGSRELGRVAVAIQRCRKQLIQWNKKNRISLQNDIRRCQEELHRVSENIQAGSWKKIHEIENKLDILMVEEEVYRKQRSRIDWLKGGDKNTRLFHWKASTRKVVANALVNRLRSVIGEVVSKNQSAFIPGRAIFDSVRIGYECMHALRTKRREKGSTTLKFDMLKAYDRVEWGFLTKMVGGWNNCLVKEVFVEDDVLAVLSIPTSANRVYDSLCWHYTEDGNYSVKSGYKVGLSLEYFGAPSSSNKVLLAYWWKFIWHLKIPSKVQMFLWKACHHWLPTKVCLAMRHIQVDVV
ncbi:hypothetical protein Ddye_008124 [Dipteronia dyeriana]|uniref:Reverse transcriptase zinc-binding domain-containing protein n=1 Tax=Dipteronia dyeriana TaxID=168575 RepID=A0AAD9X982_9ROSI|nr:hypothetical protein Ddye_008124 [Dipteronia dyeriana]